MKTKTHNEVELIALGKEFGSQIKPRDIILLNGELGAGKTTFVKGIASNLNIKRHISSPTFNIIKEYEDKLCHIDAYRIMDEDIGIDNYIDNNFIICIEWSQNIIDYIPYVNYIVNIEYTLDGREVEIIKMEE